MVDGPLKWHGGKNYLAKPIINLMPPRVKNPNAPKPDDPGWIHYVEPYFGGGQVMMELDPEGISEVAGDLNGDLINFWDVLKFPKAFKEFQRLVEATPFSDHEFNCARVFDTPTMSREWRAWAFFVQCRQSLAGRMKGFTGVTKTRARRGMNNEVSAWLTAIEGLPEVHKRLQRVLILNRPALDVIRGQDGPRTLFYLDPPYLHSTRATTGEYAHEMTAQDHANLLAALLGKYLGSVIAAAKLPNIKPEQWWDTAKPIQGRFLLSGYRSDLYDLMARVGVSRVGFDIANHSSGAKSKERKTECIWLNY